MESALQRRIQRYGWDKAAAYYESFWQRQLAPAQHQLLAMAELQPEERVIDIACGTGLVSFPAANAVGNNGYVLATDISERMMEIGNNAAANNGINHINFERMDAEELTLPDESFDVAVCALGLMYVPNPLKALNEMHRVVRTGGRAVAAVWGQRKNCGWAEIFEIVDRRVSSEVCPMFFNLGNDGVLEQNFLAAGFEEVQVEKINTILYYDSDADACGAAFAGGPVALAYQKFTEQVKEEVHREYLASIAAFRQGEGYAVPGEFVIARGVKR